VAISTYTILDSMEWAKRSNFNRPSGIGNRLEPALTSANIVAQTILSPPFKWVWNSQEYTFTCSATAASVGLTGNISVASGVVTMSAVLPTLAIGSLGLLAGLTGTAAPLNGQTFVVSTNNGTVITGQIDNGDIGSTSASGGTVTAGTTQDYTVAIPNFGYIERASVLDISRTATQGSKWIELTNKRSLALESNTARPEFISANNEDDAGNISFRVMPAPSLAFPVAVRVQLAPVAITSLNQTWAPMPDYMQYIYNKGFQSLMWSFADDPRAPMAKQEFVTHLLGRQSGLTAVERNIFLNNWNDLTELDKLTMQQGVQARGQ
jgi:hypothetical protein